jgi:hypothetical protein
MNSGEVIGLHYLPPCAESVLASQTASEAFISMLCDDATC